jgi:peptidoglycan/xylan/chitin deacetylase (PgdA/CDA1 family)
MKVKVFIDVESQSHRKRVEYVLRIFFSVYKVDFDLVNSLDDVSVDDFLIAYGCFFERRKSIFIGKSQEAINLFDKRKAYEDAMSVHFVNLSPPLVPERFDKFKLPIFFKVGEPVFRIEDEFAIINFDILSCSFYFLSCWDERVKEAKDELGRFPDEQSLLVKIGAYNFPVVNFYFYILKSLMEKFGVKFELKKWNASDFAVCLTHDVDVLRKWSPYGIYNEVVNKFIMGKEDIQLRRHRFARFIYFLLKGFDPYREGLRKIFEFEKSLGVKSTFFFKSGGKSKYDASYNWDEFIVNFVKELKDEGFELAFHPSFSSFKDFDLMRFEKEELERLAGAKVSGVRWHYLMYDFKTTPFFQEKVGFRYDSTLGFLSRAGFRCGYAFPFKVYDVDGDTEMGIYEIPIVFMDSVYQYGKSSKTGEEILKMLFDIVEVVKGLGGVVTVLFHNTVYDEFDFSGWDLIYENFLRRCVELGAFVGSCEQILDLFLDE